MYSQRFLISNVPTKPALCHLSYVITNIISREFERSLLILKKTTNRISPSHTLFLSQIIGFSSADTVTGESIEMYEKMIKIYNDEMMMRN